eukprot:UN25013
MRECGGLECLLDRIGKIKDFKNTVTLNFANILTKCLTFCAKLEDNRTHLMKVGAVPHLMSLLIVVLKADNQTKMAKTIIDLIYVVLKTYDQGLDEKKGEEKIQKSSMKRVDSNLSASSMKKEDSTNVIEFVLDNETTPELVDTITVPDQGPSSMEVDDIALNKDNSEKNDKMMFD